MELFPAIIVRIFKNSEGICALPMHLFGALPRWYRVRHEGGWRQAEPRRPALPERPPTPIRAATSR
eukprot:6556790-Heterocapsa_arctica.AAC.1